MIRVLVKASSDIAAAGLERLLQAHPDFQVTRDPPGKSAGAEPVREAAPAILVAEAETLSDPTAREAMDWAAAGEPVVLLVRSPASEAVAEALRSGVRAVLPSTLTGPQMVAAIEAAAAGLVVLEGTRAEMLIRVSRAVPSDGAETLVETLTPREVEVLRLLAAGLGNKEIAARLEISEHTVKFHVASILGKLGAGSRTEAVTIGIRRGLIMV